MAKTWFITGGTPGGFGMAFAEAALEVGDRVALTARRPGELRVWSAKYSDRVLVVPLDVTDAAQVREAIRCGRGALRRHRCARQQRRPRLVRID